MPPTASPRRTLKLTSRLSELQDSLVFEKQWRGLIEEVHKAPNITEILLTVRDKLKTFFQVQRATIYAVDEEKNELYSKVKEGDEVKEIRVPIADDSLVGWTVKSQRPLLVRNAYDASELARIHPQLKFNDAFDQKSQIRTKQVLTALVRTDDQVLGAVQLINRKSGEFGLVEQEALCEIGRTLGVAFANQRRMAARRRPTKFDELLRHSVITEAELEEATRRARIACTSMERILRIDFSVSREALVGSFARFFRCEAWAGGPDATIPADLLAKLDPDALKKAGWCPIARRDDVVTIALRDPSDVQVQDNVRRWFEPKRCVFQVALQEDIDGVVDRTFQASPLEVKNEAAQPDGPSEEDGAVIKIVDQVILDAYTRGASDIHIEPYVDEPVFVRLRIDGDCEEVRTISGEFRRAIVARIKIMANLDIAEHRKPQDGKIRFSLPNRGDIELRVATLPTVGGNEDVVLRILANSKPYPIEEIGLAPRILAGVKEMAQRPYGLILVVGPTGSGKTTTLHSLLGSINTADRKIWTAEDPVEITQRRLRQVQVHPKIGFTFASAMRAFLRADPDVIMVGEMRDHETATTAVEASLTGHLVLSTLHTNNAPETVTRLLDIGLDPFAFSDSLLGVLAQRLVRGLCPSCRVAYRASDAEWDNLAQEYGREAWERLDPKPARDTQLFRKGKGCDSCRQTGYKGRMGIHEIMLNTDRLRQAIQRRKTVEELREISLQEGMRTLKQDGIEKLLHGRTDLDQVLAAASR